MTLNCYTCSVYHADVYEKNARPLGGFTAMPIFQNNYLFIVKNLFIFSPVMATFNFLQTALHELN